MTDPFEPQASRTWPPGQELSDDECIALSCVACHTHWRIHDRLRGFRMRCQCGEWLVVPGLPAPAPTSDVSPVSPASSGANLPARPRTARRTNDRGLVELAGRDSDGDVIYEPIPTDTPMAPGTLRRASNTNRVSWTNRTILEFALLMGALLGPQLLAVLLAKGKEFELLLPFTSLLSGFLVAIVVAWAGPYGRLGLRSAHPKFFVEAIAVAALSVLVAVGYGQLLESLLPEAEGLDGFVDRLGLYGSLFVIAVTPAVLEEIIFRGMLQGRLMALFGRGLGFFVTAAAFAIVHGQPAVFPIHLGLGLYLGWLRERSDSLAPCMLMHFLYNGTLVAMEFV